MHKRDIVTDIFSDGGLTDADTTTIFEHRSQKLKERFSENYPKFIEYFNKRLEPLLKHHVNIPTRLKLIDKDWTNNNAESVNNLLKVGTNHKIENLSNLIETVYKVVRSQYKDIEKSFVGLGNFNLSENFKHHLISIDVWASKSKEERKKYTQRFYRDKGHLRAKVVSSNGLLTVPKTPSGGKKPHQAKRMAAERTRPRF